jgi:hypothetical protein
VSARYTFAAVMVLNHELAEMSGFYQRSFCVDNRYFLWQISP